MKAGELGDIRVVQGEYPQDWLTTALEKTGQKQAAWRTDPKRSGAAAAWVTSARIPSSCCVMCRALPLMSSRRSHLLREGPRTG